MSIQDAAVAHHLNLICCATMRTDGAHHPGCPNFVRRFVYSTNEESFHSDEFATRDEAVAEAIAVEGDGEPIRVWTGVKRPLRFSDFWPSWYWLQDLLQECAAEEVGDVSDHWLRAKLPDEAEAELRELVDAWATKHRLHPEFFGVDDVLQHGPLDA